ncbi:hypothetical protein MHH81_20960 [Psychrobacillus sp. FSL H8-0484]|uniref:hypothetical protein n=1 Tax=Psychrobacillus sp. FSL H8-0484 TaxID=2921390 RepID=UPI0030F70F5A
MRLHTVWRGSRTAIFKEDIPGLRVQTTPHWTIITGELEVSYDQIKTVYTKIKRQGFSCRSMKLFFVGPLPDLSLLGYSKEEQWYVYPHRSISIAAVPYGKQEWCLQIDKRNGHGVPMHILDHVPIYHPEHQINLWEEEGYG